MPSSSPDASVPSRPRASTPAIRPTRPPGPSTPPSRSRARSASPARTRLRAPSGDERRLHLRALGQPVGRAARGEARGARGGRGACAAASGMAAITGARPRGLRAGEPRRRAPRDVRRERATAARAPSALGHHDHVRRRHRPGGLRARPSRRTTRVLYLETPANPNLAVTDLAALVGLARARGLVTLADNTFATPFAQTPLALGVDLVVHSMTKAHRRPRRRHRRRGVRSAGRRRARRATTIVKGLGAVLSPFTAFLVSARRCAPSRSGSARPASRPPSSRRASTEHPASPASITLPSPSHPGHALARRQMHAFGSLLSLRAAAADGEAADARLARGQRVLEGVQRRSRTP